MIGHGKTYDRARDEEDRSVNSCRVVVHFICSMLLVSLKTRLEMNS